MDAEKLKKFIKFMDENNLCELEIDEGGKRIRLKKYAQEQAMVIPQITPQKETPPAPVAQEKGVSRGAEIKSPMVGTFYRAPSPGAKPYVEVEDTIKPGDVVCIIEAMKLMNEIKAEVGGKITAVHVDNGEPVEFDQPLFLIEPA